MDSTIQAFFNTQFFYLSLAIAAVTYVARLVIEHVLDKPAVPLSKDSKFWTGVFLPCLPIFLGGLVSLVQSFPIPDTFVGTGGRMVFGIVAGLFSGFAYRIVKTVVFKEPENKT